VTKVPVQLGTNELGAHYMVFDFPSGQTFTQTVSYNVVGVGLVK